MPAIESTCPYCGVGCGLSVSLEVPQTKPPLILGSASHPANLGRLCSKGSALAQTIHSDQSRLVAPIINGENRTWDEASSTIAQRIQSSIAEHGKESVAFYLSGQLLTEDYYVANKLMKGYIGTANVDTNSRLCMSSAVAAYKRAFGADAVPCCYDDLDAAELIILVGSNAAWTHPVLYQRMQSAKERNPSLKVILIDPRETVSCDIADLHLQLRASSDGFLFQGLLHYLVKNEWVNQTYVEQHTQGFYEANLIAEDCDINQTASMTGLDINQLTEFYALFASTEAVVSFYSQGINQSASGTDKCNAIINCHLVTGKIGYEGAGPFSITGQPNAMGGREVGGLANMLAAHMDFAPDDVDRVQRFWQSPTIASKPGLKAVDLFEAVHNGDIKVLWIMATNPAVSLPDSNYVREALERCETVIVSDVTHTDTTKYADILLPALGWGEKEGCVTNSERCISRQRSFVKGPGLAKPDWWALTEVAKKMGFCDAFDYQNAYDVFIEHASLSGFENTGEAQRCFDISGLANLNQAQYDGLNPIQWPVNDAAPKGTKRLFSDAQFFTDSGKAQFVSAAPRLAQGLLDVEKYNQRNVDNDLLNGQLMGMPTRELEVPLPDGKGPFFVFNTGRLRDQWHTMTRTGDAPTLTGHDESPFVQIHPGDAERYRIMPNDFIELHNSLGSAVLRADVTTAVNPGHLFAPIHWSDRFSTQGVVNGLMRQITDPVSGQPEAKAGAVQITKFEAAYWAKIISKHAVSYHPHFSYWTTHKCAEGYVTLLASNEAINGRDLLLIGHEPMDEQSQATSVTQYTNPLSAVNINALRESDALKALGIYTRSPVELPSSVWLVSALRDNAVLANVLRGEQGGANSLVCACFGTSRKDIESECIENNTTQSKLSEKLGCGSKCGSCKPEISNLIEQIQQRRVNNKIERV